MSIVVNTSCVCYSDQRFVGLIKDSLEYANGPLSALDLRASPSVQPESLTEGVIRMIARICSGVSSLTFFADPTIMHVDASPAALRGCLGQA